MRIFQYFSMIFLICSVTGCASGPSGPSKKQMQTVMNGCEFGQKFDDYVFCVKHTYQVEGAAPNSTSVRAFYANLDMINESYLNKNITQAQAKAYAYDAYLKTIHVDNARMQSKQDAVLMNLLQFQQQQQLQQQRTPIQTNCIRNGTFTNCTTN